MAVDFDAYTKIGLTTSNLVTTHTPVGTPRGVIVYIVGNGSADNVGVVTYGASTMAEVGSSPIINMTGEQGNVSTFFLGSGIPAGAQSVLVTTAGVGASSKFAGIITITASQDTTVNSIKTLTSNSVQNPSVTLTLSGSSSFCSIGFWSGQNNPASNTPFTSWTARDDQDFGNQSGGIYTYNTIGTTDVISGWTQGNDDAALHTISVTEIPSGVTAVEQQPADFMFVMA